MPTWYKVWSANRQKKKSVKADTLDELKENGAAKLGLQPGGMITAVDEADGTDIDEIEMLNDMNVRAVILLQQGQTWVPVAQHQPEESPSEPTATTDHTPSPNGDTASAIECTSTSVVVGSVVQNIASEIMRAPLPTFDDMVHARLVAKEPELVWNSLLRQTAAYYFGRWPQMDDSSIYRAIGQKMYTVYPCLGQEGHNPWSLFTRGLSQRIRHLKHDLKRKSGASSGATAEPTTGCFRPTQRSTSDTATTEADVQLHLKELAKEWEKPERTRSRSHIELILTQTKDHMAKLLANDVTGGISSIATVYPCLLDASYITYAFTLLVGVERVKLAATKISQLMEAVETLMGKGTSSEISIIRYMENEVKFEKGKRSEASSIIVVHDDVADSAVESLLKTEPSSPLHLLAFSQGCRLSGLFIVGDSVHMRLGTDINSGIFSLLASYYVFNVDYPRQYAMVMALLQTCVMDETYRKVLSKRFAFLVKRVKKVLTSQQDTADDEPATKKPHSL